MPPTVSPSPLASAMPRRMSGPNCIVGHVAQQDRHALVADADGDFLQVVQACDVALDAQDEFAFGQFQRTAADLAVAALDGRLTSFKERL